MLEDTWFILTNGLIIMKVLIFVQFQAPSSLLDALEQHLASLEGKKIKDSTAASRYIILHKAKSRRDVSNTVDESSSSSKLLIFISIWSFMKWI